MQNLIDSLLGIPAVKISIFVILGILVLLYVLSIIWVARDSYMRNAGWVVWTLVAVIPLVGVIAYCLLRPSLFQIDRDEQELEIAIKKRQLAQFGECTNCGYPVEADYVLCPNCLQRLKNLCPTCGRALDPSWRVCPYCGTTMAPGAARTAMVTRNSMQAADLSPVSYEEVDEPSVPRSGGSHAI